MTKTTNYQLNQWGASDPIRREDFNADNAAIEAGILEALEAGREGQSMASAAQTAAGAAQTTGNTARTEAQKAQTTADTARTEAAAAQSAAEAAHSAANAASEAQEVLLHKPVTGLSSISQNATTGDVVCSCPGEIQAALLMCTSSFKTILLYPGMFAYMYFDDTKTAYRVFSIEGSSVVHLNNSDPDSGRGIQYILFY